MMEKKISIAEMCLRTPGERLTYLRKRSGYFLDDISERTAISKSELSRLENDTRVLKNDHRDALAKAYGIERHMLDDILDFDPATGVMQIAVPSRDDDLPRGLRELPCYDIETFPEKPERPEILKLAIDIPLRETSYAIRLRKGLYNFLPDNCLLVIDPEARVAVGDFVINPTGAGPHFFLLQRNETGDLIGLFSQNVYRIPPKVPLKSFHKIICIFPAPHLVCL